MPVSLSVGAASAASLCPDCDGRYVTVDFDATMTGVLGALIPCFCAEIVFSPTSDCLCRVTDWPLNGGYCGWYEVPFSEFRDLPDGTPMLRPCPEHAHCRATADSVTARLSAPLSHDESGVEYVPSPCQSCGDAAGARWVRSEGLGVLVHKGGGPCPVSVPFDWETGEELAAPVVTAVAA